MGENPAIQYFLILDNNNVRAPAPSSTISISIPSPNSFLRRWLPSMLLNEWNGQMASKLVVLLHLPFAFFLHISSFGLPPRRFLAGSSFHSAPNQPSPTPIQMAQFQCPIHLIIGRPSSSSSIGRMIKAIFWGWTRAAGEHSTGELGVLFAKINFRQKGAPTQFCCEKGGKTSFNSCRYVCK
jgi:hypothetical protein